MKEIKIFYLDICPYCTRAHRALAELRTQEKYRDCPVTLINEELYPEIADRYDYYAVPSVFVDEKKVYEAKIGDSYEYIRDQIRAAFDAALS